jgi:hypothetical protein
MERFIKKIKMKVTNVLYNSNTFGITGRSLQVLRNILSDNLHDNILVVEIPTSDILCGFLLFNRTTGCAFWSGDGFRTDGGGEGGRGYKAANNMLETFGVSAQRIYDTQLENKFARCVEDASLGKLTENGLHKIAEEISDNFINEDYKCYYNLMPIY